MKPNRNTRVEGYGTQNGITRPARLVRTTKTRLVLIAGTERNFLRATGYEVGHAKNWSGWAVPREELQRLNEEFPADG